MTKQLKENLEFWLQFLGGLALSFAVLGILIGGCLAIERYGSERRAKDADSKAFCDSAGGKYGGGKCYKDGKELKP